MPMIHEGMGRRPRRLRQVWHGACVALIATSALGLSPGSQAAQAAPASGGPGAVADTDLEEVVVYARRRPEPLIDAPLAITVRSGPQLQQASATLFDDVARGIPNVRMISSPQSVSALDVTIRGQTVNRSAIVFDPAVGLYIDGVYVANGQGAMGTLLDIDSVEVVRGSQGTLFGRNNTGGSISFRTHRPEPDRYALEASAGGGDYRAFTGRVIGNLPLGEGLAVRVAYQDDSRRGFGSSVASGQDNLQNRHRYQARVGLLWAPSTSTEAYFTYERFEAKETGAILHPLAGPAPGTLVSQLGALLSQFPIPGLPTVLFPADPFAAAGTYPSRDTARTDALQLTLSRRFDHGPQAKLILGYRRLDARTALDVDASALPLADSLLLNTSNQKSAELQLSDAAFDGRLNWVAGLYWFRDSGSAPSVQQPASPDFLAALDAVNQATEGAVNLAPLFTPLPVYEQNAVLNRSAAGFMHGEWRLTPRWAVAAGLRRTEDQRELAENSFVIVPGFGQNCTILDLSAPPPFQITGPCPPIHKSVSYGFWSWEVSSHYRFNPGLSGYVRVGRSQRSGGWNAPLGTLQDQPFRPEQLTDYEIGLKASLLGGLLAINGDVFYGDYDDMQRLLARLNPDGTPVTLVTNAGRARLGGAELEAVWRVAARATLQGSFGWTDARYRSFEYTPVEGAPPQDLSGNDFYQTPRLQAAIGASYEVPTAAGDITLHADYAWQDRIQFNVINDFNYQPSYGTANARVVFTDRGRSWELAAYANNVTDRRYAYAGGTLGAPYAPAPSIAWRIPGEPRTFGVEATYRWSATR